MALSRRNFLSASGALLASCRAGGAVPAAPRDPLDALLRAHADVLPERAGAGADHYPMAAEALVALGRPEAIDAAWVAGASGYAGAAGRVGTLIDVDAALGRYDRYGDLLDHYRRALAEQPWQAVVATAAPRLAPGLSGACCHGLIRTAHAVRALRDRDTAARRGELAVGLAYWAARYAELPTNAAPLPRDAAGLRRALETVEHPWQDDPTDVAFDAVDARLAARPLAPAVGERRPGAPEADLDDLVRAAAAGFLEMLVLEQHRIWLLHTVTGPAAAGLLLPEVDAAGRRALVDYARQATVAMFAAYGAPFRSGRHVRAAPGAWSELIDRAVASRSVHTIKLIEALVRFDVATPDDPLLRSVAAQWLEWT